MSYVPIIIKLEEVGGLLPAMRGMKLPKKAESDSGHDCGFEKLGTSDAKLAGNLIRAGDDHAKAMRGIIVWFQIQMQTGFMIEFETYRHGVECISTSSAMHGELKKLTGHELAEQKQQDLVEKVYTRSMCASYQALRSMYRARWNHRHPDWRLFCKWIETLPYAEQLIMPEGFQNVRLF